MDRLMAVKALRFLGLFSINFPRISGHPNSVAGLAGTAQGAGVRTAAPVLRSVVGRRRRRRRVGGGEQIQGRRRRRISRWTGGGGGSVVSTPN